MFSRHVLPLRYNSERLEIKAVIGGNFVLFKDIKISLGLSITVRKLYARENHYFEVSTTANNRIRGSAVEPKIPSKP